MPEPSKETLALLSVGEWDKKIEGNIGDPNWYLIDNQIVAEKDGNVTQYKEYRDSAEAKEAFDYVLDAGAGHE